MIKIARVRPQDEEKLLSQLEHFLRNNYQRYYTINIKKRKVIA